MVYSIVRDLCSYILAAFGTLCQSKVQDSNDEACSEVAEVPYKVREEQKNKEEQRNSTFCCVNFGREAILSMTTYSSNNTSKRKGKSNTTRFQALRQARAETAALSCRSDIQEVWMWLWPGLGMWEVGNLIQILEDGGSCLLWAFVCCGS